MSSILDRRVKYSGHKHTVNKTELTIKKNLDMSILNLLCSYILSGNRNIRRGAYINLRNFISCLDLSVYNTEPEKLKKLEFIQKGLEARLEKNLSSRSMIKSYINGGILADNIVDLGDNELSNQEIDFVNEMVTKSLYYTFIDPEMDVLTDLCIRWKSADFNERVSLANEVEQVVTQLYNKFRRSKVESVNNLVFSLKQDTFEEKITDIRNKLCDPSRMMITGMQGINEILGGGFYASRVYLLLGLTGVGKSMTMLNMMYQMKKYNKRITPKDPTKVPCIVYITMENDIYETVERLFSIATGEDLIDYSVEEIVQKLKTEGELYINEDSPIDTIIKYVPNRSVDTGYLYTMVEDLEDDGYEVLAVMLDHVKRIRSVQNISDLRLELGEVINEFKVFATLKDLIFITDSHLNRDAAAIIDKYATNSKADLTKMLGKANVGESLLMLDNSDCCLIINKEFDENNIEYMVFKRIKMRYKNSGRDYICQPFREDNKIRFVEDIGYAVPAFKESLHEVDYNMQYMNETKNITGGQKIRQSNYCNITYLDSDNDYDTSSTITKYSEDTIPSITVDEARYSDLRYMSDEDVNEYYKKISDTLISSLIK